MSATNMKLFLLLGFSLLLYHEIEGITTHTVTGCTDSVVLNCSITEMIHVERITYYNGTDCNQAVTDLQVCGQPLTGSDTGLITSCNGKTSCIENLYYNTCPGSTAAKLDYRCIPGYDVIDMCGSFIIKHIDRIFIKTPNYLLSPTFTDISPCRCPIRGSSITSIQILELALQTTDDGTKSSLEINYGDVTYKTESYSAVLNERLSTASTTAEIILNNAGSNKHHLWIEVQGIAMRVACNIVRTPTSSATTSLQSSSSTTEKLEDKDPTPVIIVVVLLFLCILIVCIADTTNDVLHRGDILSEKKPYGEPRESEEGRKLHYLMELNDKYSTP